MEIIEEKKLLLEFLLDYRFSSDSLTFYTYLQILIGITSDEHIIKYDCTLLFLERYAIISPSAFKFCKLVWLESKRAPILMHYFI